MALTLKWWLALTTSCCVVVWLGLSRAHPKPTTGNAAQTSHKTPAELALYAVSGELLRTADRVRQLEIRDSLLARHRDAPPGLTVLIDSSVPAGLSTSVERLLRAEWDRMGVRSSTPVIVALVLDSATMVHGYPRRYGSVLATPITVFLPQADGAPCLSLLRMSESYGKLLQRTRGTVAQNLRAPETISAAFGPCAFLAQFGTPGRHVAAWLRGSGWSYARLASWDAQSPPWTSRSAWPGFYRFTDQLLQLSDPDWRERQIVGLPGLACIAGEPDRCADAAGARVERTPRDSAWSAAVVNTRGASAYALLFNAKPSPLGANDSWLVSDMARSLGATAFRRFWTSDEPVDRAFQSASGESLDTWVRGWARRSYGRIPTGPSVAIRGLWSGAAALVLGFAMAVVLERRRRVA